MDPVGAPASGARITGFSVSTKEAAGALAPEIDIVTDAKGHFEIETAPGRYFVRASKGDLASDGAPWSARMWRVRSGQSIKNRRIPLAPGGTVVGFVRSKETGKPLADVDVAMDTGALARTDRDGRFVFQGVGRGERSVLAVKPGLANTLVPLATPDAPDQEVVVKMPQGYVVRGRATDAEGRPVAGVTIRGEGLGRFFFARLGRDVTDAEGRYEIGGYPVGRRLNYLSAEHPDFARQYKNNVPPPREGRVLTVDFRMDSGYAVTGRVVDEKGKPVRAYVSFGIRRYHGGMKGERSDAKGFFRLERLSHRSRTHVCAQAPGYAPACKLATSGKGKEIPHVKLVMKPGRKASGRVVDAAGAPLRGATVSPAMTPWRGDYHGHSPFGVPTRTDTEGRFELSDLPDRGVAVTVYKSGHSYLRDAPITLDDKNVIALRKPGVIRGKVVDGTTGEPVAALNVRIGHAHPLPGSGEQTPMVPWRLTRTGRDFRSAKGVFSIDKLVTGAPHAVTVKAEGYAETRVPRVLARPRDWKGWPVVIKVGRGTRLTGVVLDAKTGGPLAGVKVSRIISQYPGHSQSFSLEQMENPGGDGSGRGVESATTDKEGRFSFTIGRGAQYVSLLARRKGLGPLLLGDVSVEKPQTLRLAPAAALVVTDSTPRGTAQRKVPFGISVGRIYTHLTIEKGSQRVDGLPAGQAQISFSLRNGSSRTTFVELEAGKTTELDLAKLPGHRIRGRVTRMGRGVAEAHVSAMLLKPARHVAFATTGSDGRYTLEGAPKGRVTVTAYKNTPRFCAKRRVTVGGHMAVDFVLDVGRIRGVVTHASTGRPMARVSLALLHRVETTPLSYLLGPFPRGDRLYFVRRLSNDLRGAGLRATRLFEVAFASSHGAYTDDLGRFEAWDLPKGSCRLAVHNRAPAYPHIGPTDVAVTENAPDVRLAVKGSEPLRLRLQDARTGKAVTRATLHLRDPDGVRVGYARVVDKKPDPGQPWDIRPGADGTVTINGLQVGAYVLWVVAEGYGAKRVGPLATGKPPVRVALEPTGPLLLKLTKGTVDPKRRPYVVYRIRNGNGKLVCPGGEACGGLLFENGAAWLDEKAKGVARITVIPPGSYTMAWEVYRGDVTPAYEFKPVRKPLLSGRAAFTIRVGEGTTVVLGGKR